DEGTTVIAEFQATRVSPGSMRTLSTSPSTHQNSEVAAPMPIGFGSALKVVMMGRASSRIVTDCVHAAPSESRTSSVTVVSAALIGPMLTGTPLVTGPMPAMLPAPSNTPVTVTVSPGSTDTFDAWKLWIADAGDTGGTGATVTTHDWLARLPQRSACVTMLKGTFLPASASVGVQDPS